MLPRLTASEPAGRVWIRRWDKPYAPANLQSAFDKVWRNGGSAGADEFVILCGSEAEAQAALAAVRVWGSEAGLRLHPEKTRIVNATQPGGIAFLGYDFERGMKWPRPKSLGKLKVRVRAQTSRLDGRSLSEIVADVNRS
jgi:hypothetical protein